MRFFSGFGNGFKAGDEIGHDLQGEKDGSERGVAEGRLEICGGAGARANEDEEEKYAEDARGGPALKRGTGADATIVEESEEQSNGQAKNQARKKNGLAGDAIEFEGIEPRKNVGGKLADDDGFPWTDDEVGEKHDPAGEIADERRKDLRGVGRFAGGVGKATNPLAVDVSDGKKKDATEAESKHGAERAATCEPVVHENDPAGADHGAKAESEIVGEGEFAGESGHW